MKDKLLSSSSSNSMVSSGFSLANHNKFSPFKKIVKKRKTSRPKPPGWLREYY